MCLGTGFRVNGDMSLDISFFLALTSGELEHAGVPGNDHADPFGFKSLLYKTGQLFLIVGITGEHLFNAKALEQGFNVNRPAGMVLVTGHGRGTVFHDDQGDIVMIENGIDQSGQTGMKKGGIS